MNDTRVAQQFSLILILPIIGIFVAQLSGVVLVSFTTIAIAALVLLFVDIAMMRLAVQLFQRETILTNWS